MFPPIEVETETIITSSCCNNNNSGGHEKELVFDSNQSSFSSSMRSLAASQQSPESPKVVFITLSRRRSSVHNLVNAILGRPPDNRRASVNEFTDAASLDEIAQCMNSIGGGGGSFKIKRFGAGGISSGSFRFSSRSPMANSCGGGVSPLLSPVVFMVEEEEVSNTEITIKVSDIRYENDDSYYDYEDNINDCSGCDDCDDDMIPLTTTSGCMVYSEDNEKDKKEAIGDSEDIIIIVDGVEKGNNDNNNNDVNIIVDNDDINDSYNDDDDDVCCCGDANNNVYDNYDELHSSIDEDEHREKEEEYFTSDSRSDNNDNAL